MKNIAFWNNFALIVVKEWVAKSRQSFLQIRQHQSTYMVFFISTEMSGKYTTISTTVSKLNLNKSIFGVVIFEVIEADLWGRWVKSWEFGSDFSSHTIVSIIAFMSEFEILKFLVQNPKYLWDIHICKCKQFLWDSPQLKLSKFLPRSWFSSSWINHRTICWISKRFCQKWHWCRSSLNLRFFLHRNPFLIWIDSATKVPIVAFVRN